MAKNEYSTKPWLEEYPDWLPAEIDTTRLRPLHHYLKSSADRFPQRPAFSNFGTTLTYQELDQLSQQFGAALRDHKLIAGDRLAIMLPNILQYPVVLFGALRQGMVVVNVNPLYTQRELKHQLIDSGAKGIVVLENFAHVLEGVIHETKIETVVVARVGDCLHWPKAILINSVLKYVKKAVPKWDIKQAVSYEAFMQSAADTDVEDYAVELDDLAFLQYTGGTTGLSKGVELVHRSVSANVEQAYAWTFHRMREGQDIAITALPLYHIFALTANCLFITAWGGLNVLITNPRDFRGFVKTLSKWKFSYITGVNTLFTALLNTEGFDKLDFSNLRVTLGAGMAVTRQTAKQWRETTGQTLVEIYGLSEASPAVTANPIDLEMYNGKIGLPVSSTDVQIVDEQGSVVSLNEPGELCVKGPQVMRGYWNNAQATKDAFTDSGYLKTGDWAVMDESGYIQLLDRKKDMVIVSGFNVYPNEIENVVGDHPGVLEVAAVGVPDERSGERIKLFIVPKDKELSVDDVKAWCKARLTSYKLPKDIEFCQELPKTSVGKILRRALRDGPVDSDLST